MGILKIKRESEKAAAADAEPKCTRFRRKWIILGSVILTVGVVGVLSLISLQRRLMVFGKRSRTASDLRMLETLLSGYAIDHNRPPPMTHRLLDYAENPEELHELNGFGLFALDNLELNAVSPVVEGMNFLYRDPFSGAHLPYAYFSRGGHWMILSTGPDGDYDLEPFRHFPEDPEVTQESEHFILNRYDPTNGLISSGDYWKTGGTAGRLRP